VWLDSTTRVSAEWINPEGPAARKLGFEWANGNPFSFDLGGVMLGGDWHHEHFFAEVKNQVAGDGTDYRDFVAKAMRALLSQSARCDHFIYISWAPFLVSTWGSLCTWEFVQETALDKKYSARVFGDDVPKKDDLNLVKQCQDLAEKLWLIILSDKQVDFLRPDRKHVDMIRLRILEEAES
jgi:thiamine kinase-like enzyme